MALMTTLAAILFIRACTPPNVEVSELEKYDTFARSFLDWYYAAHAVRATDLGIHDYDHLLPDWSQSAVEDRTRALREWLSKLEGIRRDQLSGDAFYDYRILEYAIRAELLDLEEVRRWERNPMHYISVVSGALSSLADRDFAPVSERMKSMTARMERIPALLEHARTNLQDVPPLWVELAARNARGLVSFLESDLQAALAAQGLDAVDEAEKSRWDTARAATIAQVNTFSDWLEADLAPRATGDFRLGKDIFERKLLLEEHVDIGAERLMAVNDSAIARYQKWVAREAARLDKRVTPAEVMKRITSKFPTPEMLIPTARQYVDQTKEFVIDRAIVTLPSNEMPVVRPTPEYARMGFASMSTPGPFETKATEAYYNITNVDPDWTEEQKAQHLSYFNFPGLLGITVHEVMPGHFVQLLFEQQIPTEVRKVFTPASLVEGWAHYAEQMMVDEGLGDGDATIRLGQLRRALQRHARWYAGLSMHAFGVEIEDAARRYQEIAYFAEFPALRETQRGTYNPTYLYYALGRMQILKLREDYRALKISRGEQFSLREFHDEFLRLGLPVALAREVLLGPGAGASL